MRNGIVFGILWCLCLAGCEPARQGTREQIDDACSCPVRATEGAGPVFFHVPGAGDALRDPGELRAVPAAIEGAVIQGESALHGTGEF